MKKKIIVGIVIAIVIIIGVIYGFFNRGGSAVTNLNNFATACNQFNLQKMSTYATEGGELNKLITQMEGYDSKKKDILKDWASNIKIQVLSTEKSDGDTVIKAKVYSLNGVEIYNDFQSNMQGLNINNTTIQDNDLNGDFLNEQYNNAFINAVQSNLENVTSSTIDIKMKREMGTFKIVNDNTVIQGLLGGLNPQYVLN